MGKAAPDGAVAARADDPRAGQYFPNDRFAPRAFFFSLAQLNSVQGTP
jgi:hypothetical protein